LSKLIESVTGVVLAGGKSTRMGRNKATLEWNGQTLQERSASVLRECFTQVLLVAEDDVPGIGPLGGIVTALRRAPAIFVVACDMPFLNATLIRDMAGRLPGHDAVAIPGEPLHAGYGQSALPAMEQAIAAGEYSVHKLLGRLRVKYLSDSELIGYPDWRKSLTNINTPQDWEAAKHHGQ
jgi:molybdopterin-guanine dinucleotide biosynthesis protein A